MSEPGMKATSEVPVLQPNLDREIDPNLPEVENLTDLPQINGHQITLQQYNTFRAYLSNGGKVKYAAQSMGLHAATVSKWRREPWWKWLEERYIEESNRRTHLYLLAHQQEAVDTLLYVMRTEENGGMSPDDKTAGGKVNAARLFLEVGNDPLIKKHPSVQINNNTIQNYGEINISKLKQLPSEKLHEIAATFEIPDEVKDF